MTRSCFRAVMAAVMLFCAHNAGADTVLSTLTSSFGDEYIYGSNQLDGSPVLTLAKYDGPGTLSSVQFTIDTTINGDLSAYTTNANGAVSSLVQVLVAQFDIDANTGAPSALLNLSNPTTGGTFSPFSDSGILYASSQYLTAEGPNTVVQLSAYSASGSSSASFTGSSDLAGFVGTGSYSFSPYTTIFPISTDPDVTAFSNIYASATITVEYIGNLSPSVPEPSSLLLASIGAGSVAIQGWRTRSRRMTTTLLGAVDEAQSGQRHFMLQSICLGTKGLLFAWLRRLALC